MTALTYTIAMFFDQKVCEDWGYSADSLYKKVYDNEWTIDLGDVPAAFKDIAHYLGFDGVVRADAVFEHLAELIDPSDYDQPHEYCPNCGCRVVSDDD